MEKHYDIGLYGWWGHDNFGGCLTYFALHETLKNMGYSVLMIQEALGISNIRYKIKDTCIAMRFAKKHYDCSAQVDYKELPEFNDICDTFFVGGDQLWNNLIPFVSEDDFLNWVNDDKRKISYSTSFGSKNHNPPVELKEKYSELLQRYNAISVRENYAPDLSKKIYGVEATEIIDAVFLQDKEVYEKIAKEATVSFDKKYLLAFILNPIPEKRKVIEDIAEKLGIDEIICIPDAAVAYHKSMNEVF
ncbi:MAG: polysaccharide pyruvyl transferase family protein, partial [Oscillospiraceae bacterium]|nr:polysaccharide pyruvyl transferase family protein [Oscillospiraceae bacterium]